MMPRRGRATSSSIIMDYAIPPLPVSKWVDEYLAPLITVNERRGFVDYMKTNFTYDNICFFINSEVEIDLHLDADVLVALFEMDGFYHKWKKGRGGGCLRTSVHVFGLDCTAVISKRGTGTYVLLHEKQSGFTTTQYKLELMLFHPEDSLLLNVFERLVEERPRGGWVEVRNIFNTMTKVWHEAEIFAFRRGDMVMMCQHYGRSDYRGWTRMLKQLHEEKEGGGDCGSFSRISSVKWLNRLKRMVEEKWGSPLTCMEEPQAWIMTTTTTTTTASGTTNNTNTNNNKMTTRPTTKQEVFWVWNTSDELKFVGRCEKHSRKIYQLLLAAPAGAGAE